MKKRRLETECRKTNGELSPRLFERTRKAVSKDYHHSVLSIHFGPLSGHAKK
jgi:hypothetical protein